MNIEDIDGKIGMPNIYEEWERFEKDVIGKSIPLYHSLWRKVAIVVGIIFCATIMTMASIVIVKHTRMKQVEIDTSVSEKPMVEYMPYKGKRVGDGFIVNLCPGTYVSIVRGKNNIGELLVIDGEEFSSGDNRLDNYVENNNFRYAFLNGRQKVTMQLDGVTFDRDHLPTIPNKKLKKIDIVPDGDFAVVVNLITKESLMPVSAKSNVPHEHTLALFYNGELGIASGKAIQGDWIHYSVTTWEINKYKRSVKDEIMPSLKYGDYKLYVYACKETPQVSFELAKDLIDEMGISSYEFVRDIPVVHWTDGQYRAWALEMKDEHPQYDWKILFMELAKENVSDDLKEKWHIVKEVYGVK